MLNIMYIGVIIFMLMIQWSRLRKAAKSTKMMIIMILGLSVSIILIESLLPKASSPAQWFIQEFESVFPQLEPQRK